MIGCSPGIVNLSWMLYGMLFSRYSKLFLEAYFKNLTRNFKSVLEQYVHEMINHFFKVLWTCLRSREPIMPWKAPCLPLSPSGSHWSRVSPRPRPLNLSATRLRSSLPGSMMNWEKLGKKFLRSLKSPLLGEKRFYSKTKNSAAFCRIQWIQLK